MYQFIYPFISVLLFCVQGVYLSTSNVSRFQFTKEARDALCPFVGTEGLRCFDEDHLKNSTEFYYPDYLKLPRSVGITVDRSNGQLKAPAIQLTYTPPGTHLWIDDFSRAMFDTFYETILLPAGSVVIKFNSAQSYIFRNASELDAAWQETFSNGEIRGGVLARPVNMLEHFNK